MSDLHELLHGAAARPSGGLDVDGLHRRAMVRRRGRIIGSTVAALTVVGAVGIGTALRHDQSRANVRAADSMAAETATSLEPDPHPGAVTVRIVDENGSPFPAGTAGVQACPLIDADPCGDVVMGVDIDGDGTALLVLEPDVEYRISAYADNTGPPVGSVNAEGDDVHRSAVRVLPGAKLTDGTVFVIRPPHDSPSPTDQPVVGDPAPPATG